MIATKKRVKFVGDFKTLIPSGWKFGKAYARNYRFYSTNPNGLAWPPAAGFTIWQARREFALDQHNKHVVAIVEKVISGLEDWRRELTNGKVVYWLTYDKKENRFIPYGTEEYREIQHQSFVDYDGYLERYETVNVAIEDLDGIAELLAKNWIKLES